MCVIHICHSQRRHVYKLWVYLFFLKVIPKSDLKYSDKTPNPCLNDAWEVDSFNECKPKQEFFSVECNPNGIEITVAKSLIPDAKRVFLLGDCQGTLDDERKVLNSRRWNR